MRWKWSWLKGCYRKGYATIHFVPLARNIGGVVIIDDPMGRALAVTIYDEGKTSRSKCTIFQSRFASLIGNEVAILPSEEALPYVNQLREAISEASQQDIDVEP